MNAGIADRRLAAQRLVGPPLTRPGEVVGWLGAVQAQDYAGAKWSLGQRLSDTADASLDAAFASGEILRTHVLRPTWHFVTPADLRGWLALTAPRVHGVNGPMYRRVGVDAALASRCHAVLEEGLVGRHLSRPEVRSLLHDAGIDTAGDLRFSYLLMWAELDGVICSGPRVGRQFSYALLADRAPQAGPLDLDQVAADLAARYVRSHGPVTDRDFAWWSGLRLTAARAALLAADVRREEIAGVAYWGADDAGAAGAAARSAERPRAWLLSVFDEYVIAYADRSAIVDATHGERLRSLGNDLTGVAVIDGRAVGTWKRVLRSTGVAVTVTGFRAFSRAEQHAVDAAAHRLAAFLRLPLLAEPQTG